MNTVFVVTLSAEHAAFARLLPPTNLRAEGAGRIYFFYASTGEDLAFRDLDGELLIETHAFATLADAKAWASKDARLHARCGMATGEVQ